MKKFGIDEIDNIEDKDYRTSVLIQCYMNRKARIDCFKPFAMFDTPKDFHQSISRELQSLKKSAKKLREKLIKEIGLERVEKIDLSYSDDEDDDDDTLNKML